MCWNLCQDRVGNCPRTGNFCNLPFLTKSCPSALFQKVFSFLDRKVMGWKSVRNEFFKVWLVCIPFQLTIKDRKMCQAVFIYLILINLFTWVCLHHVTYQLWGLNHAWHSMNPLLFSTSDSILPGGRRPSRLFSQ